MGVDYRKQRVKLIDSNGTEYYVRGFSGAGRRFYYYRKKHQHHYTFLGFFSRNYNAYRALGKKFGVKMRAI